MTNLLSWATVGSDVLVGLADPADASRGSHVVPGRIERDSRARTVVRFTLPCGGEQVIEAHRLSSMSAALHLTEAGDGWAVTAFADGSEAQLRWQIREAQLAIRGVLGDRLLGTTQASRKLAELAATLHSLMLRAELMSVPIVHRAHPAA
ncbi:MAG TPA: hypothetical protein VGK18_05715 [Propionicimonas sp.]|jgi:hypothetical protein|uniref:hypothetical protein n=1 Tax=Propionicimonas sp. TaxID=1955623 RepID=UPI002F4040D4